MRAMGGLVVVLALAAGSRRLRRRLGLRRSADHLLRPRGGARRTAPRAVHRGDRDRGRGALRRQRRARSDDRRGGRELARGRLLRAGSRLARAPSTSQLAELPEEILDRVDRALPRRGRALGRHVRPLARDRLQHRRARRGRGSRLRLRPHATRQWKGRIGIAPDERVVPGVRHGDAAVRRRRRDAHVARPISRTNDPKEYEKNTPIVEAVAAGEVDLGLVNHYYLYLVKEEQPDAPIANHFLAAGDPGALVSVAGAGVLASSDIAPKQPSASSSSCSPTTGSASTSTRPRKPSTRSSTGSSAKEGLPPLGARGPRRRPHGLRRRARGARSSCCARPAT